MQRTDTDTSTKYTMFKWDIMKNRQYSHQADMIYFHTHTEG